MWEGLEGGKEEGHNATRVSKTTLKICSLTPRHILKEFYTLLQRQMCSHIY